MQCGKRQPRIAQRNAGKVMMALSAVAQRNASKAMTALSAVWNVTTGNRATRQQGIAQRNAGNVMSALSAVRKVTEVCGVARRKREMRSKMPERF